VTWQQQIQKIHLAAFSSRTHCTLRMTRSGRCLTASSVRDSKAYFAAADGLTDAAVTGQFAG